jgi:hypothetical protein
MPVIISSDPPRQQEGGYLQGFGYCYAYTLRNRLLEVFLITNGDVCAGLSDNPLLPDDLEIVAGVASQYWAVYFDSPFIMFHYTDGLLRVYFQNYQVPVCQARNVLQARSHVQTVIQLISMGF